MNEEEILTKASFWLVVAGSIVVGLEGLGVPAGRQLNPVEMASGQVGDQLKAAVYLLIGFAGVHQAYFGYTSLKTELENR